MSEQIDIRATLSAEDKASKTIQRYMANLQRLEKQMKETFAKKSMNVQIVDGKTVKALEKMNLALRHASSGQMSYARNLAKNNQMSEDSFLRQIKLIKNLESRMKSARGAERVQIGKTLRLRAQEAEAYQRAWNEAYKKNLDTHHRFAQTMLGLEKSVETERKRNFAKQLSGAAMVRRLQEQSSKREANEQAAKSKREERTLGQRLKMIKRSHDLELKDAERMERERASIRRSARSALGRAAGTPQRMMDRLDGNFFQSPFFYGTIAAGISAAIGKALIREAVSLDKSETFTQIHMGVSAAESRRMRNDWAIPEGVRMGVDPADLMNSAIEAAKAGVPNEQSGKFAVLSTQFSKMFDLTVSETANQLGYAIAQESKDGKVDMDKSRRLMNMTGGLAQSLATNPHRMLSYMQTALGSGAAMGLDTATTMAFGGAATSLGAQGQQAARMLGHLSEQIHELPLRQQDVQRKHTKSAEDRLFLSIPQMLGYGSYKGIERDFKKDPNKALPELLERFNRIKDPYKRDQAVTAFFGADFKRFVLNMIRNPGMFRTAQAKARELEVEGDGEDWNSRSWAIYSRSLANSMERIKALWQAFKGWMGDVLAPFIRDFADAFTDMKDTLISENIKDAFQNLLTGFIRGLGFEDFRQLIKSVFSVDKFGVGTSIKFFEFAKGFGAGLKAVWDTFKTIASAFGVGDNVYALGKFVAEILGFATALHFLRPVLSVLGLFKDLMLGIGAAITGGAGMLAARGLGGGLMGLLAGGALGGPALLGLTIVGGALAVAVMNWDKILPALQNWSKDQLEGTGTTREMSEEELAKRRKGNPFRPGFWDSMKYLFSPSSANAAEGGIFKKTSLGYAVGDMSSDFRRMGAQIQLASLSGGMSGGASALSRAIGGGGSGASGFNAASIPDFSRGNGAVESFGLGRRGIIGGSPMPKSDGAGGMRSGGSRSWRNNNPGNITFGPWAKAHGATGADGRFAVFPDYATGRKAHEDLLFNSPGYKGLSVGQAISKWAPPSENDTAGYIRSLGIDPSKKLADMSPDERTKMLDGMQKKEGWIPGSSTGGPAATGLADKLGIKGGANFMHGQYGGPGQNQTWVTLDSGKKVQVNAAAAESFKGFLNELEGTGYNIKSLGGFANRSQANGSGRISQHAYGNAIDINPFGLGNGFSKKLITNLPPNVSDMAAKYGLSWGGDWKNKKDAMHFEWMGQQPQPSNLADQIPVTKPKPGFGAGGGATGGSSPNVNIHINGHNGDPEALANQVQKRIDENLKWRTHDMEFDV